MCYVWLFLGYLLAILAIWLFQNSNSQEIAKFIFLFVSLLWVVWLFGHFFLVFLIFIKTCSAATILRPHINLCPQGRYAQNYTKWLNYPQKSNLQPQKRIIAQTSKDSQDSKDSSQSPFLRYDSKHPRTHRTKRTVPKVLRVLRQNSKHPSIHRTHRTVPKVPKVLRQDSKHPRIHRTKRTVQSP